MSTTYNPFTASVQDNVMCIALSSNPMPAEKFVRFCLDVNPSVQEKTVRWTLTHGVKNGWLTVNSKGVYKRAMNRIHDLAHEKNIGMARHAFGDVNATVHGEERVLHHIQAEPGLTRRELHIRMCADGRPRVLLASTSSFITHNIKHGLAFEKDGHIYPADMASLPKSMLAEESDDASIDVSGMVADLKAAARAEQDATDMWSCLSPNSDFAKAMTAIAGVLVDAEPDKVKALAKRPALIKAALGDAWDAENTGLAEELRAARDLARQAEDALRAKDPNHPELQS